MLKFLLKVFFLTLYYTIISDDYDLTIDYGLKNNQLYLDDQKKVSKSTLKFCTLN